MKNMDSKELLLQILKKLDELTQKQLEKGLSTKEIYLDNQEFMQLLKISPRTAQHYRDEGLVTFSQIGSKIYYSLADIHVMLEKHKRPAFPRNR